MARKFLIYGFCILLLGSFKETSTRSSHIHFLVKIGNNEVGTLEAIQAIENEKVSYFLHSEVQVGMLFNLKIQEKISDVFERGNLSHSTHTRYINGDLKSNNSALWNGNSYLLKNKNQHQKHLKDSIYASVLSIYFREPKDSEILFSHSFQELLVLRKTGTHKYMVKLPNGNITSYLYKNGRLEVVESTTNWGVIQFVRKD
ncbi:MAG TPA: DUF6134 family protein, partial [Cytophagales bacterium]|nr:DUF6134 family protein [Cytophagales bacterium]